MKLKLTWLLTLFMAFVMQFSFAQEKIVTGTVTTAEDGLPLPGASVIVKGTSRGQQTDFDGKFSINAKQGDVLIISYVGMKNTEINVGASNSYNVKLALDNSLEEVVVVGYSSISVATSKASTVRVSAETIENRPNASFVQTLSGQVAGLNITTSNGQPGGNSLVQLRGVSSLNGNTEPLFIIDGAPVDEDNFRSLNPQDIASIDVLKDAGATAIYGNRGANGVIIIKTRQGGFNQALKVNYSGFVSYSNLQDNDWNLMDSQQLLRYERQQGVGVGAGNAGGNNKAFPETGVPYTDAEIAAAPDTDWLNYFFRTAVTQNHNLSFSSGGENSSQFTSLGYQNAEGILTNSSLKRFNLRTNVNGKSSNDKFNYGLNLTMNYSTSDEPNNIGGNGVNRNFVIGALSSLPYNSPSQYTEETINAVVGGPAVIDTPFFLIDLQEQFQLVDEEVKIVGSMNFSYAITDWLTARSVSSFDYQSEFTLRAQFPDAINSRIFGGNNEFQDQDSRRRFTFNQLTSLNASKTYGKHTFDVGLYTEYFKGHLRDFGYFANGLNASTFSPGDGDSFISDTADDDIFVDTVNANILNTGLFSYFGSLDYDYDTKYGFGATVRRDASSRFAGSNRWGTFWSVSGRWNISNEEFMSGSVINNLKIRGSYGTNGNQDIIAQGTFSAPDLTEDFFTTTPGYGNQNSIALSQIGNRGLKWETIAQGNVGIDFGVWQNRLRGSFDVYQRTTTDLYVRTPLSAVTGVTEQLANIGKLQNRGLDFIINYELIQSKSVGGFNLSLGLVGNYNETELQELPSTTGEIIGTGREGGKIGEVFTLQYIGVNPASGNLLYLNAAGEATENPDPDTDRKWLDKNVLPDWNGSFNFNLDYKGFFLTTQWNYAIGIDRFDNDYAGYVDVDDAGQFNLSNDITRQWQQPGDITDIPSPDSSNRNSFGSNRFLYSSDFLRLRFASIGYKFPQEYLDGTGLTNVSVFVNAENALTFTPWRGLDAESRETSRAYPTPRTFSVGVELGF
jgi:TonB-linked SusC/RagA family outer membrane protein